MNPEELRSKLDELMALPCETEWVEFKEAKSNIDFNDLGVYFSALSNEANLKQQECAWLVLGVTDKPPRKVVGTQYCPAPEKLQKLKHGIADHTTGRLTFEEIYELSLPEGRVLMFQIPRALRGIPTAWKGHYYGREDESKAALSLYEIEQIRAQSPRTGRDEEESRARRQCYQRMLDCVEEEFNGLGSNPNTGYWRSLNVDRERVFKKAIDALPEQEKRMAQLEFDNLLSARPQRLPEKRNLLDATIQKIRQRIQEINGGKSPGEIESIQAIRDFVAQKVGKINFRQTFFRWALVDEADTRHLEQMIGDLPDRVRTKVRAIVGPLDFGGSTPVPGSAKTQIQEAPKQLDDLICRLREKGQGD